VACLKWIGDMCAPYSLKLKSAGPPSRIPGLDISLPLQVNHQFGQVHFRLSRLKAAFQRSLHQFLELIRAHALQEEIRIATDVLGRREGDRIDPLLDHNAACSRKAGD